MRAKEFVCTNLHVYTWACERVRKACVCVSVCVSVSVSVSVSVCARVTFLFEIVACTHLFLAGPFDHFRHHGTLC